MGGPVRTRFGELWERAKLAILNVPSLITANIHEYRVGQQGGAYWPSREIAEYVGTGVELYPSGSSKNFI